MVVEASHFSMGADQKSLVMQHQIDLTDGRGIAHREGGDDGKDVRHRPGVESGR